MQRLHKFEQVHCDKILQTKCLFRKVDIEITFPILKVPLKPLKFYNLNDANF